MRPRTLLAALALAAAVGFAAGRWSAAEGGAPATRPPLAAGDPAWTLVRVVDGDTLVVTVDGAEERVRLRAIDTPERGDPGFEEATAALRGLLKRGEHTFAFESPGELTRDRYGRILAYALADDLNTSVEMVRLGWSDYATQYGPSRFDRELRAAEAEARAARRGRWATR